MDSTESIKSMLSMKVWAVVGATDNPEKFGNKIYRRLQKAGYEVFPVNPGVSSIQGEKCYASLADLPVKPDAVNFAVPPNVGEIIVGECAALGIKNVWLQPGSNADTVVEAAKKLGLNTIHNSCILTELYRQNPSR